MTTKKGRLASFLLDIGHSMKEKNGQLLAKTKTYVQVQNASAIISRLGKLAWPFNEERYLPEKHKTYCEDNSLNGQSLLYLHINKSK